MISVVYLIHSYECARLAGVGSWGRQQIFDKLCYENQMESIVENIVD